MLTSVISFLTAANAKLVAKPVIVGILPSISVISAFKSVFLARSLVSRFFFSASLILFFKSYLSVSHLVFKTNPVVSMLLTLATHCSYTLFLAGSFFATLLSLAKSLGTGVSLSISGLSATVFKLVKFDFSAKVLVSTCNIFFQSVFVA